MIPDPFKEHEDDSDSMYGPSLSEIEDTKNASDESDGPAFSEDGLPSEYVASTKRKFRREVRVISIHFTSETNILNHAIQRPVWGDLRYFSPKARRSSNEGAKSSKSAIASSRAEVSV